MHGTGRPSIPRAAVSRLYAVTVTASQMLSIPNPPQVVAPIAARFTPMPTAYPPGSWTVPPGARTAGVGGVGRVGFLPLIVPEGGMRIDALAADVTAGGAAGAVLRAAVYSAHPVTGYPDRLLLDAGTQVATAVATVQWTFAAPLTLPAGLVWIAAVTQVQPSTVRFVYATTHLASPGSASSAAVALIVDRPYPYIGADTITGAFPAQLTYTTTTNTTDFTIGVTCRVV